MVLLSIIALIVNSPWYFAEDIERLTGYYPQWIVDVFGGLNSGIFDITEALGNFIMKIF